MIIHPKSKAKAGGVVVRASDSQLGEPGSNLGAGIFKTGKSGTLWNSRYVQCSLAYPIKLFDMTPIPMTSHTADEQYIVLLNVDLQVPVSLCFLCSFFLCLHFTYYCITLMPCDTIETY